MDYYKKKTLNNIFLLALVIIGIVLQFIGHKGEGYSFLFIQFVSLGIMLLVLYLYNKRHV